MTKQERKKMLKMLDIPVKDGDDGSFVQDGEYDIKERLERHGFKNEKNYNINADFYTHGGYLIVVLKTSPIVIDIGFLPGYGED